MKGRGPKMKDYLRVSIIPVATDYSLTMSGQEKACLGRPRNAGL